MNTYNKIIYSFHFKINIILLLEHKYSSNDEKSSSLKIKLLFYKTPRDVDVSRFYVRIDSYLLYL